VLVQLAADVELLRPVDRAVFTPRPRVDSALIALRRRGPGASDPVRQVVREAFAHRRKSLPRSVALAAPRSERAAIRERAREALRELGLPEDARAESLSPGEFERLVGSLQAP
jgi:16S rRNA (adenine1518-N6/adenine1519-N6)-dimethyltransferase